MKVLLRAVLLVITVLLIFSNVDAQTFGVKKRRPKPHEYGNVIINNYSEQEKLLLLSSNTGSTEQNIPVVSVMLILALLCRRV